MNDLERIAMSLVEDIIKYQKMGGDMNNLTPRNVYNLINGIPPQDDLSKLNEIENELLNASSDELEIHHIQIKNLIDDKTYKLLYRIISCPNKEFNQLNNNEKINLLKEGYKKCILKDIPLETPVITKSNNNIQATKQL